MRLQTQPVLSLPLKRYSDYWRWCRGSKPPTYTKERRVSDVVPRSSSPPPIATSEPPPRWRELPPVNRRRLLVSLSHLLEYRLEEPATMPKREVKDHDRG